MRQITNYLILGLLAASAVAEFPREMRFQGRLVGEEATNVQIDITIYNAAIGGAALFSESHTNVLLNNGVFAITIGSETSGGVPAAALQTPNAWLGVSVDGGAEMLPRTQLLMVPYAGMANAAHRLRNPLNSNLAMDVSATHDVHMFDLSGNEEVRFDLNGFSGDPVISMYGNGLETLMLRGDNSDDGSLLQMRRGSTTTVSLEAASSTDGGALNLMNSSGDGTVWLEGDNLNGGLVSLSKSGNVETVRLMGTQSGTDGAALDMYEADGTLTVNLRAQEGSGSVLNMYNSTGTQTVEIDAHESSDAVIRLSSATQTTIELDADHVGGGGRAFLRDNTGTIRIDLEADDSDNGAARLFNSTGDQVISLATDQAGGDGQISVMNKDGNIRAQITAFESSGGQIFLRDAGGNNSLRLYGENPLSASDAAAIYLRDGNTNTLELHASWDGTGQSRVITDVLEIQGGADLSEQFDVTAQDVRPGMVVSIDPLSPGKLTRSSKAYDRTVAGVVSGANGIRPGFLMSQHGSVADGEHPVALTGRVWVWCDADSDSITPGDLLTTSATPGHAMKASDLTQAQGAVLGKAMTKLESGRGLVLVLVSLQ